MPVKPEKRLISVIDGTYNTNFAKLQVGKKVTSRIK